MGAELQWLPADGSGQPPEPLMLLLHGVGASAQGMAPLADALRQNFPRDGDGQGR